MQQNRVTKTQAIALKKLGYDGNHYHVYHEKTEIPIKEIVDADWNNRYMISAKNGYVISAPTFSDVIQFFWDKFGINIVVNFEVFSDDNNWQYSIEGSSQYLMPNSCFKSREAAQSAGLDAAIAYKLKQLAPNETT